MSTAAKAASLSAFVFPGSGHLYLKCYVRAALLIGIAAVGLYMLMSAAFVIVWSIASGIEPGTPLDIQLIRETVRNSMVVYEQPELQTSKWAIVLSWIVSVADAYRVGKQRDNR
ncbi:MAG: hypothetical protein AAFZ92_03375 [Pseudomonadota bacterium]